MSLYMRPGTPMLGGPLIRQIKIVKHREEMPKIKKHVVLVDKQFIERIIKNDETGTDGVQFVNPLIAILYRVYPKPHRDETSQESDARQIQITQIVLIGYPYIGERHP